MSSNPNAGFRFVQLAILFFAITSAIAQQISEVRLGSDGVLSLRYGSDLNSYFVLLRGEIVTAIELPRDIQYGTGGEIELRDSAAFASAGFYRVRQISISQPLDLDGDGLNDLCELRYRPNLDPFTPNDGGIDADSDGKTTLEECAAGTDPFAIPRPAVPRINYPTNATTASFVIFTGTGPANTRIRVEGGAAYVTNTVDETGGFELTVPLALNRLNRLFVSAVDQFGAPSPLAPLDILQDSTPPYLFIDFPTNNAIVTTESVLVAGRVGDALSGFLGLNVTVNDQPARVDVGIGPNGTYERAAVPLSLGRNAIRVLASDRLGNATPREIVVYRQEPQGARLLAIAGDMQETNVFRRLAQPLAARLTQADGAPIANEVVNFQVTRSDGRVLPVQAERLASDIAQSASITTNGAMYLQLRTDANGEALVWWTLGTDSGHANNRVQVWSGVSSESVTFCASALPLPASQMNIGSGNNQRGETLAPAHEPLRVWVSDGNNPGAGVEVTFRVVRGGGLLYPIVTTNNTSPAGPGLRAASRLTGSVALSPARSRGTARILPVPPPPLLYSLGAEALAAPEGASEVRVLTSITGHAEVDFSYGPEFGNQVVEATFSGNQGPPATFMLQGLTRIPGQPTTFTGVVQDNTFQPIAGADCELVIGASTNKLITDAEGRFAFVNIPDGSGHFFVNGAPAYKVGNSDIPTNSFPSLHYTLAIVPNAENSLPAPVLLPRLNTNNARWYAGTNDLVLTCEGVAGLKMSIKANSMKHPSGELVTPSRPAWVSLNQVHHDDVPMPMPDGASPPFAWTLQPGGATFDPPVAVEYPNMSGLAPGAVAYFLTFNHDTERFEIVSSGQVVEDGSIIKTDPGSGLTISGWGCNCPPYSVTANCSGDSTRTRVREDGSAPPTQGNPDDPRDKDDPANCEVTCKERGTLNIGTVVNVQLVKCVGEPLTFSAPNVSDSGGNKQRVCVEPNGSTTVTEVPIPPAGVIYSWVITRNGQPVASGSGPTATFTPTQEGSYVCQFKARANRKCPPAEVTLPGQNARVIEVLSVSGNGVTSRVSEPGPSETIYICKGNPGETITLAAQSSAGAVWPQGQPVWNGATGSGSTATFPIDQVSPTSNGTVVRVSCNTSVKSIRIVVVEVEAITANGITSRTQTPGPAETVFVCLGVTPSPLILEAISRPFDSFPANSPFWFNAQGSGRAANYEITSPSQTRDGTRVDAGCGTSRKAIRVVTLKLAFAEQAKTVCWSARTFDAKGALTSDSFDKNQVTWSIATVNGPAAAIDQNGLVTFGAEGGTYTIKAVSKDMQECLATMTLGVLKVVLAVEENLTECMEDRTLTFTATGTGPTEGPFTFTFHYTAPDGTEFTSTDFSIDLVEDNDMITRKVLDNDADHKYPTANFVEISDEELTCRSDNLPIDVYELWIEYVRDSGTSKPWKVVVGENISYKAIASSDCGNFEWDMEDGVPDAWNPTGGNAKTGIAMVIPYSDLTRSSADWYGETYGTVTVRCTDGDGNPHEFLSTSMNPPMKAKLFFPPDLNKEGLPPSQDMPPCWFLFWPEGAVPELKGFTYDHSLGAYGQSQYDRTLIFDTSKLWVGPAASATHYPRGILINGTVFGGPGVTGIDCCAEVVSHERAHNMFGAQLHAGALDSDNDTLPDAEEAKYACFIGNPDTHGVRLVKSAEYATYGDNEYAVMVISHGKKGVVAHDWSKGGKQW